MTGQEVELDQHAHATRSLSALLSAALAAAQAAAQVSAQRARATAQRADQQTRQAEQVTREQARLAQQQAERQQRATQNVQHRQWSLKPTAQWLHDKPLSAAAVWASADVAREQDPAAARHAEQWEAIFKQEGVDVDEVRADAPAAVAAVEQGPTPPAAGGSTPEPVELAAELTAVEVASGAVLAGAADVAHAAAATAHHGEAAAQWTAYADGEAAAALGGRGVSTPPSQVLAKSREAPDLAATTDSAARSLELVNTTGVER